MVDSESDDKMIDKKLYIVVHEIYLYIYKLIYIKYF